MNQVETLLKENGDLAEAVCRLGLDFTKKTEECDELKRENAAFRQRVSDMMESARGYMGMLERARKESSDQIGVTLMWQRKCYAAEDRVRELENELERLKR